MRIQSVLVLSAVCGIVGVLLGSVPITRSAKAESEVTGFDHAIKYKGTLLVQLAVNDLDEAVDFYTNKLELEIHWRSDELQWCELETGIPGVKIGVGVKPNAQNNGGSSFNIGVVDLDATRALLESRGVVFDGPTMVVPDTVKLAELRDPSGNRIRLAQNLRKT